MDYNHLISKVRHAANGGINVLSTGEALAAALVLNRFDWLSSMGYTMAEALDRIDDDTLPLLRQAERQIRQELAEAEEEAAAKRQNDTLEELRRGASAPESGPVVVGLLGTYLTHSESPGYRDVTLLLDVTQIGTETPKSESTRLDIRLNAADSAAVLRGLLDIHNFAWIKGEPIDAGENEKRPAWLPYPPSSAR